MESKFVRTSRLTSKVTRRRLERRIWITLTLLTALGSTGCHVHCPDGEPSITAFETDKASVKAGDSLTLTLKVSNFLMDGHSDDGHEHEHDAECTNSGHAHVYLDEAGGQLLVMAMSDQFSVTIPPNTTVGVHKLVAQLQNNDHKPLNPTVETSIELSVN